MRRSMLPGAEQAGRERCTSIAGCVLLGRVVRQVLLAATNDDARRRRIVRPLRG